ncbi:helix-turn-helix domain-containing protein [Streptomyces sp. NPDC052192]|uniref:PucR family transcriptional regulator n=1 Tax=Streptomyces sp. NPDC052192 TaxID=3155052 RepID=UPI003444A29E
MYGTSRWVPFCGRCCPCWYPHLPEADDAPPRMLREVAEVLARFQESLARRGAAEPSVALHGGTGRADSAEGLNGALAQARYALASARTTSPDASALIDAASLTGLGTLLTGIPAEVRTAFSRTVLGPLFEAGNPSFAALLETLEIFLACDGSWSRTAEALHLHVNTVHYRVQRVEHFTGRDLSSLYDRLDLRAALLCRPRRPARP